MCRIGVALAAELLYRADKERDELLHRGGRRRRASLPEIEKELRKQRARHPAWKREAIEEATGQELSLSPRRMRGVRNAVAAYGSRRQRVADVLGVSLDQLDAIEARGLVAISEREPERPAWRLGLSCGHQQDHVVHETLAWWPDGKPALVRCRHCRGKVGDVHHYPAEPDGEYSALPLRPRSGRWVFSWENTTVRRAQA